MDRLRALFSPTIAPPSTPTPSTDKDLTAVKDMLRKVEVFMNAGLGRANGLNIVSDMSQVVLHDDQDLAPVLRKVSAS